MLEVVCGVFFRQHEEWGFQVAIFRRLGGDQFLEFPGGKIEAGEGHEHALVRELQEELQIPVQVLGFLGESRSAWKGRELVLRAYWVKANSFQDLRLVDHSEWFWQGGDPPLGLAPADIPLWNLIFQQKHRPPG